MENGRVSRANLILCCAPRSGSTQLAAWLDTHPDISLAAIKEPNFFSEQDLDPQLIRKNRYEDVDPAEYVRSGSRRRYNIAVFRREADYNYLFSSMTSRWKLDASTSYLISEGAPGRIYDYNPDAVVVILTRHPVDRAWSHYRLGLQTGKTWKSLAEIVHRELEAAPQDHDMTLIRFSRYRHAVSRYKAVFPEENLFEIRFEELVADPLAAMTPLLQRLSVNPAGINLSLRDRNSSGVTRFPLINHWATRLGLRSRLRHFLPYSIRKRLLSLLYSRQDAGIPDADRRLLEEVLADEVEAYEGRTS